MPYDQSVRTLMNNSGYDNNKIGYDNNSGYVTYDKQPFMKPQMNVNGTGYTDQATFDNSHNQYKQQNPDIFYASGSTGTPAGATQSAQTTSANPYQGGIFTSKEDSIPYEQRLAYYANNPNALHDEYNRSQQALGAYQAIAGTGNPEATQHVNDATAHIQKLQQIMNAQPQNKGPDINGLVNSVYQRVMNQQPYDVYSSPEYKAAQSASDYGAHQAVRQSQESMGASGFGRSTNLADRAQTIQQGANDRLLAQVVPQLLAQHRAQEQQQTGNLMGLISPMMQQQQNQFNQGLQQQQLGLQKDNQDFSQQHTTQQDHISLANFLTQQYGVSVYPTEDPAEAYAQVAGIQTTAARKIATDAQKTGFDMAIKQALAENTISKTQADIALKAAAQAETAGYHNAMAGASQDRAAAAKQNADTNANKPQGGKQGTAYVNSIVAQLNKTYGEIDPTTGKTKGIPAGNKDALRKSIIGMNLPDETTDQLLGMYGLPTN